MAELTGRIPHVDSEVPRLRSLGSWKLFSKFAQKDTLRNLSIPVPWVVAGYLILPNLSVLLSASTLSGLPHGYINVECLAIGAFGLFLPRRMLCILLIVESVLDFSYSLCYTYRFTLGELISSLRYLTSLPPSRLFEGFAVLVFSVLLCAMLAVARPRRQLRTKTILALLTCGALATAIDVVDGQNFLWRKDATLTPYRLVRSPAAVLAMWEVSFLRVRADARTMENLPMDSASARGISFLEREPANTEAPNVVLILVESWGLPLDNRLASALTQPFEDRRIGDEYEVSSGTVPFSGLTVPGEARELCHSTAGFAILNSAQAMAPDCLPALFHTRGYENLAVHGFLGQMFYRNVWYPQLGFDHSWFRPNLEKLGLPNCPGAFPGTCDTSIAEWVGRTLQTPSQKPRFIYWVTLNSHLPEPAHPSLADDGVCATQPQLEASTALCSWFRIVREEHEAVGKLALLQTTRPTVFILVGDHAPPFSSPALRAQFSSTQVPFVMLTPKALPLARKPQPQQKSGGE